MRTPPATTSRGVSAVQEGCSAEAEIHIQIPHIQPDLPVFCMSIMTRDRLTWRYSGTRITYAGSVIEVPLGGRLTCAIAPHQAGRRSPQKDPAYRLGLLHDRKTQTEAQ